MSREGSRSQAAAPDAGVPDWGEASLRALEEGLEDLHARLARRAGVEVPEAPPSPARQAAAPSALAEVITRFGLTPFERDLLLLCAGCELDGRFGDLVGRLEGGTGQRLPTFSLALAALDGGGAGDGPWRALAPDGVLRRARLLALGEGATLATRPLRIEEAVLHHLTGQPQLDERLRPFLLPAPVPALLTAGQERAAEHLVAVWSTGRPGRLPAVHLSAGDHLGVDREATRAVAAAACRRAGFVGFLFDLDLLPADAAAREDLLELWARDAVLGDYALILELGGREPTGEPASGRRAAGWILERLAGFVVVTGEAPEGGSARPLVRIEVAAPGAAEQRRLWAAALGPRGATLDGQLDRLVQQFTLAPAVIREIAAETTWAADGEAERTLWQACRRRARGGLDELAQRIEAVAGWDDLVLPEAQMAVLRQIATHVRQRARVYEDWGFARRSPRGLGISALFAGASGTGKTMAAEVLASDLGLDLYRIDLSAAVSKYIGETEKNLRRIFDAAEASGAILLFDEADALFGKRSEVKDSHDRYANLEISYLLQRIETYRGLAILTTNLQRNLDAAFQRRLRFILQFPHPGPAERAEIWRRIFPPETPVDGLDAGKLARLAITGGNIRSIALAAAVLAADDGSPVGMGHVLQAAQAEYGKLGKSLSDGEVKGWV